MESTQNKIFQHATVTFAFVVVYIDSARLIEPIYRKKCDRDGSDQMHYIQLLKFELTIFARKAVIGKSWKSL